MPHADARTQADGIPEPTAQPGSDPDRDGLTPGGRAATQRLLKKYGPFFEHARQSCHAHLRANDYAALVREVTWMAKLDDALINDLCLMTGQSPQQAEPYRQIRRGDIEMLRFAASRIGNTAASLRADQLMRSMREMSTQALPEFRQAKPFAASNEECSRDSGGSMAAGPNGVETTTVPQVIERRKR